MTDLKEEERSLFSAVIYEKTAYTMHVFLILSISPAPPTPKEDR